jgi:hypothetical protein
VIINIGGAAHTTALFFYAIAFMVGKIGIVGIFT